MTLRGAAWRALLEHRDYPAEIRDTLGEAVSASVLAGRILQPLFAASTPPTHAGGCSSRRGYAMYGAMIGSSAVVRMPGAAAHT